MPDAKYNLNSITAVPQTLPTLTIVALLLSTLGGNQLNQPVHAAGAIQPPSCEHPPLPPPQAPYPTTLSLTPINAPIFIPPSLISGSGGEIQPPSCEHPPAPKPVVPYPIGDAQTPVNSPSFPPPVPPGSQPPTGIGTPVQPPSCEHPPAPQPPVPYPGGLTQTPVNSPSFPPPVPAGSQPPTGIGTPVQPPSCEHPPLPGQPVPYPGGLTQTPVNSPSFPGQPVRPVCPQHYGYVPFVHLPAIVVPGAGNAPGIGIPGNVVYGAPGTTTLRDPLVPGASFAFPGTPIPLNNPSWGLPPPIGSGLVPNPVNPGMLGQPPTVVPWADGTAGNPQTHLTDTLVIPSNQIDQQSSTISMPLTNAAAQAPLTWNSQGIRGIIPKAPSTPGADPGILRQPGMSAGTWAQGYSPAAALAPLGDNGQLTGSAPITRSLQRGQTHDFGLGQNTPTPKTYFAYRMQVNGGQNGPPTFSGWQGLPGSTAQDFGVGVKQLSAAGQLGSQLPPQTSYNSARPAEYPGGQGTTGNLNSNSLGNHGHNADPPFFAAAQVTNDLYGTPMINPARKYTDGNGQTTSGIPLTTIAPY